MSQAPGLFLTEFSKRYKVENIDGVLTISDVDGKPMMEDGKPVAFEAPAIWRMLTGGAANYGKTDDAAMFGLLLKWAGPSGSGASASNRGGGMNPPASARKEESKSEPQTFGLR